MTDKINSEIISFKTSLYAQYWDKPPVVEIFLNDESFFKGEITNNEQDPYIVEFKKELQDEQDYKFTIKNIGKDDTQTVVENNEIIKDQLIFIKSIEIDNIDIGGIIYEGKYYPEYPEPWATEQRSKGQTLPEFHTNVTSMGHNGRWELDFKTPFYMWLLENLY